MRLRSVQDEVHFSVRLGVKKLCNTCGLITEQSPMSVPKKGKKLVVSRGSTDDPNLKTTYFIYLIIEYKIYSYHKHNDIMLRILWKSLTIQTR